MAQRVKAIFAARNISVPDHISAQIWREVSTNPPGQFEIDAVNLWQSKDLRLWYSAYPAGSQASAIDLVLKKDGGDVQTIKESVCLQIDYLKDISRPAYQQLQKVINRFGENVLVSGDADPQIHKVEEHGKRMLLVNFTDGVREIQGMEYQGIPQLNTETLPGTKVRLIPPIICRKRMLMLKSQNVQIIGGSVAELVSKNAQKHILASILKTDLAKLEKTAPPCPPPNIHPNQGGTNQVPVGTIAGDPFDDDGDAFLASVAEPMDDGADDFLGDVLSAYEAANS